MSLSFPSSPTNGQTYQGWIWSSTTNSWNPNYAAGFVTSFNGRSGPVTLQTGDNTVGNRVLISSTIVAPASPVASPMNFFYNFTNQFDQYELDIYDLQLQSAMNYVCLRISTDGSTWDIGTNYSYALLLAGSSQTNPVLGAGVALSYMPIMVQSDLQTASLGAINLKFNMPWVNDRYKIFDMSFTGYGATYAITKTTGAGIYAPAAPIKGYQLFNVSGTNFTRGVFNLYGIVKAGAGGS